MLIFIGTFFTSSHLRLYFDIQRFSTAVRDGAPLTGHEKQQKNKYIKEQTKSNIYNALTWRPSIGKINIPSIELKIPQNILDAWRKSKQKPTADWKNALSKTWAQQYEPIKVRVRGDYSYHWGVETPSLKIKMPKGQSFLGYRKFNLINPRSATGFERVIGAQLATTIGLLSEDVAFVRVFVNGENWGPFQFVGSLEEAWLRKQKQLPGDVYSGEVEPVSKAKGIVVKESKEDIWFKQQYWEKVSYNNAIQRDDFSWWQQGSQALQDGFLQASPNSRENFEKYFDVESLLKLMALENYIGSRHTDRLHNWKLLHDPANGKLRAIAWDMWGHGQGAKADDKDLFWPLALPQLNVLKHSDLYLRKNQILYQLLKLDEEQEVTLNTLHFLKKEVLPLYQYAKHIHRPIWIKLDPWTEVGTALEQKRSDIDQFYRRIGDYYYARNQNLKQILNDVNVEASLISTGSKYQLKLSIMGESAVELKNIDGQSIYSFIDDQKPSVLYPAVSIEPYKIWHSSFKAQWQKKYYYYDLKSKVKPKKLEFVNLVTERKFDVDVKINAIEKEHKLKNNQYYNIDPKVKVLEDVVIGPGQYNFKEDKIFPPGQKVQIMPGTNIVLAPGKNLIIQGDLVAKGSQAQPIRIYALDKNKAFGAVVVQSANTVTMEHVHIENGSGAAYNGVNYTGMLSIYNAKRVGFSHVHLKNNHIYDDMANLKHVKSFLMDNCVYAQAYADGLDLDYAKGQIINSQFIDTGNDGLDMMGSQVNIKNSFFKNNRDKGISVGEASLAQIQNSTFYNVSLAIAVKDLSIVQVSDNTLSRVKKFASLYQKSAYYYMGGVLLDAHLKDKAYDVDPLSIATIDLEHIQVPKNREKAVPLGQQIELFKHFRNTNE
ncbi:MAG TPA: CotH kinase family protein [Oligoflexia bacterium]|nr:CotH kinase family protein [Oligoflexia bacterium]